MHSTAASTDEDQAATDEVQVQIEGAHYKINSQTEFELSKEHDASDMDLCSGSLINSPKPRLNTSPAITSSCLTFAENNATSVSVSISRQNTTTSKRKIDVIVDEEDFLWRDIVNEGRMARKLEPVSMDVVEELLDAFEKRSYMPVDPPTEPNEEKYVCVICLEDECHDSNVLVLCDGCDMAVHQDCYGIPYIPEGDWFCRRCFRTPQSPPNVKCSLCPRKNDQGAAFKETVDSEWVHMVCALSIDELDFINRCFLEPVSSLKEVKRDRFAARCSLCQKRDVGACVQCHHEHCFSTFHATCAQCAGFKLTLGAVAADDEKEEPTLRIIFYCQRHSDGDFNSQRRADIFREKIARDSVKGYTPKYPKIDDDDLTEIMKQSNELVGEEEFFGKIFNYWRFRRIQRNGAPLPRLLTSTATAENDFGSDFEGNEQETLLENERITTISDKLLLFRELSMKIRKHTKLERKRCLTQFFAAQQKYAVFQECVSSCIDQLNEADPLSVYATRSEQDSIRTVSITDMYKKLSDGDYTSFEQVKQDYKAMCSAGLGFGKCSMLLYTKNFQKKTEDIVNQMQTEYHNAVDDPLLPKWQSGSSASDIIKDITVNGQRDSFYNPQ